MGILRVAFGLGLVVLLLPSEEGQQQKLYQNASYAVERATTFCDRNAKTCETASNAWSVFVRKMEFAAKLAYDVATSASRESEETPRYEPAAMQPQRTAPPRAFGPRPEDPANTWRRSGT